MRLYHILPLLIALETAAMPPRPDRIEGWSAASAEQFESIRNAAKVNGLDAIGRNILANMPARGRDEAEEATLRVPVILVDFADNAADQNAFPAARFQTMLFSEGEYQTGSMHDFYLENSSGAVSIVGEVVGWYRAPQNYSYYTNRQYGLGVYPRNSQRLAEDAIRAADNDIDFSQYDNDGDGVVDAPFIVHAGGGAEENPNNVSLIWSHAWNVQNLGELDGVRFFGYTMVPEDGKIGVFSHELGHGLFGLPDLYDTRNVGAGLGVWSVMAYGAWGDEGRRPVHFDAWSKLQLDWITAPFLPYNQHFILPAIIDSARAIKLWNPEQAGREYFLAEYRTRTLFDGELPADGLLIYHIDEAMGNNDHPWYPGNEGNLHDLVALEQADNAWDLERGANVGDAGDPYPGNSDNHRFDFETSPGSLAYSGDTSSVAIIDLNLVDGGVEADWVVGLDAPPLVRQTLQLHYGWNLVSLRVTPEEQNVVNLVAPLLEAGVLLFVKDGSGRFYAPEFGYSNIPFWDLQRGYFIKVSEDTSLTIEGEEIEFDRAISLHDGWQVIAYYPDYALSPQRAFERIQESIDMVKDGSGRFYIPRHGFNNMPDMSEGKGYFIKFQGNGQLVYPTP